MFTVRAKPSKKKYNIKNGMMNAFFMTTGRPVDVIVDSG